MLNEIASGTRDAATGLNKLEEAAKDAGDSLEDIGKKLDAGNLMEAADTLSGAGDKIIEAGQKMTDSFASLEGTTTKVNGYFGLTGEAAEQMGSVVENVFKSGVTDSLESVGGCGNYRKQQPERSGSITAGNIDHAGNDHGGDLWFRYE